MEAEQSPAIGMAGLAGLATSASLLSRHGSRYDTLLTSLESALVERVEHMSQGVLRSRPHGVPVGLFDVITGLAGAGRYLLGRAQSAPCRRALETLLGALVYLSEEDADAVPHWHTTFLHSTDNLRKFYPDGHVNLGIGTRDSGTARSVVAFSQPGCRGRRTTRRDCPDRRPHRESAVQRRMGGRFSRGRIDTHGLQGEHECGPFRTRVPTPMRPRRRARRGVTARPGSPARCGSPGSHRVDPSTRDLALAAMIAVFERPIPNRRIDAPTLCHGVAGLLQITLRFARDGAGEIFSAAAQELTAQLLDAHEPDSRFGYRDLKPSAPTHGQPRLVGRRRRRCVGLARHRHVAGADLGPDPDAVMTLYEPLDFAVVRAPLLPVDTLDAFAIGDKDLRDVLSSEARAALAVASLTFSDALARDGAGPLDPRTESVLRRYLIRMSTRPTPLGLFAAVGLANWGERTDIELIAGHRPRRTRPDAAWLHGARRPRGVRPADPPASACPGEPLGVHACRANLPRRAGISRQQRAGDGVGASHRGRPACHDGCPDTNPLR